MYNYADEKKKLLVPENFPRILKAKEAIDRLMENSHAAKFGQACGVTGFNDSFMAMACVDYLTEQGYYLLIGRPQTAMQDNILVFRR